MPTRKTAEEMALARRIKVTRTLTRLKYALMADEELNGSLAAITDDHNTELQTGGLKELNPETINKVLAEVRDE